MKRIRDRQLRATRAFLVVVGAALFGLAIAAALLAAKVIESIGDPLDAHTPLLNASGRRLLHEHELAFQLGAALAALLFIGVGFAWLLLQIPSRRRHDNVPVDIGDTAVDGHNIGGRNTIAGDALAEAFEADLERSPLVARARAELRSGSDVVRIRLDVDEDAPVDEILATVVDPAIARIVTVADLQTRPRVQADIRPVAGAASPS
ncbi:MAG: hypothetical protein QOH23_1489 [Gaiellaceae bacterium]|jgi:hypothetical protein|nr:hypothetical protein [Gaiellaceae bacterium]